MFSLRRVAFGIVLLGTLGSSVQADPITWPSGLDTWLIFLAGQQGSGGGGLVTTYHAPAAVAPAPQATSVQAAVVQPVAAPVSALQVVPVQPAQTQEPQPMVTTPVAAVSAPVSPVQPAIVSAPAISAPAPSVPVIATPPSGPVAAYINLGNGPYPLASSITSGNALPWYDSAKIGSFFGGTPSAQQIQSFDNAVVQQVQQSFSQSGVSVSLTTNPNAAALHTLSLVSNTAAASLSNAIGMTQLGASGFSFIDQIAPSAQNLGQLEMIVAHNISHELMLAFGVGENYDQTGNYIDARNANWSMMVNPNATFSTAAAAALTRALANQNTSSTSNLQDAQVLPPPIPEPSTVALWTCAAAGLVWYRRGRVRRDAARDRASI
jgi:hypothetical protein